MEEDTPGRVHREVVSMPSRKDELAERRFTKLVDQIKAMMPARLKPGYRGFYGQLVLTRDAVIELGDAAEVRRAARTAGSRLGWKARTHLADDEMLVIIDDRDPPQEIRELAARRSAEARLRRTSAPSTSPTRPADPGKSL
ncbi:hypothetical protein [Nonomuraea sp. GTA35]|uniref:hypothetical protein n=1 Tax=Nonomuraea sp. GTA35 TaxID=1676746 RepID=UPI0035C1A05E